MSFVTEEQRAKVAALREAEAVLNKSINDVASSGLSISVEKEAWPFSAGGDTHYSEQVRTRVRLHVVEEL